jgi:flagellar assembly factor FliW
LGAVEVPKDKILCFVAPLLGFESLRKYALLPVPGAQPFFWLQSLEEPHLAFPVVSAGEVGVAYPMRADDLRRIAASSADEVTCWVVVALPGAAATGRQSRAVGAQAGGGKFRLNLRAPVLVNARKQLAAQIVLSDEYPIVPTEQSYKERAAAPAPQVRAEPKVSAASTSR